MDRFKDEIAGNIFKNRSKVMDWFEEQYKLHTPPFYSSYDIRDSGFKIAPVDFNLYPAGFNNICSDDLEVAPDILKQTIVRMAERYKISIPNKIVIIPESHTSNKYYAENLYELFDIFRRDGFETQIGWVTPETAANGSIELETATGKHLTAFTAEENTSHNRLVLSNGFNPDWIIANNDFSAGYPEYFDKINQPVFPTHKMGWHTRRKSKHFEHYNRLVADFADLIQTPKWTFQIETEVVKQVDFNEGVGLEETASACDRILNKIRNEYESRKISVKPAVFVKSDTGTYGIGIHVIRDAKEILTLNRRTKNKLSVGKGKSEIRQVIVQEGIPSQIIVDKSVSEPVIYILGCELLGGFIRSNTERGDMENLNSQGMLFRKLCMRDLHEAWTGDSANEFPALEAIYGSLARIAGIASAIETEEVTKITRSINT